MGKTSIEWCDYSVNPIRARRRGDLPPRPGHYCEKVSPGCSNCYASRMQPRFGMPTFGGGQHREDVELYLDETALRSVRRRKRPTRYFWCDMTDMFGAWVPDEWIDECFSIMGGTPQHTHQVLTKRPERMLDYMSKRGHKAWNARRLETEAYPPRNVWLGVSVEDQRRADERIPLLLQVPAAVRFLSCEPLLGSVDLSPWLPGEAPDNYNSATDREVIGCHETDDEITMWKEAVDWIIVGGESGPGARPCDLAWLRSVVAQCRGAGVPCFVKQFGARPVIDAPPTGDMAQDQRRQLPLRLRDKKGGDPAEWPVDLQVREFPTERDE